MLYPTTEEKVLQLLQSVRKLKRELDQQLKQLCGQSATSRLSIKNVPFEISTDLKPTRYGDRAQIYVLTMPTDDGDEQYLLNAGGVVRFDDAPAIDDLYIFFTSSNDAPDTAHIYKLRDADGMVQQRNDEAQQ